MQLIVGGTRRKYTEEFKREAVALTYSPGKTIRKIADDLGINSSMLGRWRSEMKRLDNRAFPGHGIQKLTPLEQENLKLKRELAIITEERDILKKAVAIFSKQPR